MATVLAVLLFGLVSTGPWIYQPVGAAPVGQRCEQAAWLGEEIVAACRDGLWRGRPHELRLLIPCGHDGGAAPQLKAWGRHLIASCACGLFLIQPSGITSLGAPGRPGALAATVARGLVVEVDGCLWHWAGPATGATCLHCLPEGSVADLRWQGAALWILRWKGSRRLVEGRLERLGGPGGAWIWSDAFGRTHWVDSLGHRWTAASGELPVLRPPLRLLAGEHVRSVRALAGGLWLASGLRWWWRGPDSGLVGGRLPALAEKMIPVRPQQAGLAPPWLLGRHRFYRPRRSLMGAKRPCKTVSERGLPWPGLRLSEPGPWPLLHLKASTRRALVFRRAGLDAWNWTGRRSWAAGMNLSWPLGAASAQASQSERTQCLEAWRAEGRARQRLAASLAQVKADLCAQGASAVDLDEVHALQVWLRTDARRLAEGSWR